MEDPSRPDICSVPLFRDLNFEGRDNGDLSINNLNMLDVTFFSQTKGDVNVSPLQRNIGTVRKLAANYLFFRDLVGGSDRRIISSEAVDKFLKDYFHFDVSHPLKGQGMSTNGLFHIMVNWFRIQIYELKGIPTETRDLIYQGKRYSMTVSKLGCQWEKDPNP